MINSWKQLINKLHGAASDSLLLTFVKVITALLGLVTTKLLSTQFSLQDYGTYSQAMLLVSTVTSLTILGLTDATNYFYNAADDEKTKQRHIATIFGLQYGVGIVAGVLICICCWPIIHYFHNPNLRKIILIAAWMPVFGNLLPMLQVLFISIGKAKVIAVRNFVVSIARLFFVALACFITQEIRTIFILLLLLDMAQVIYFYWIFGKNQFWIKLTYFSSKLVKPILCFSIPMTVFIFTNALSRDIDKYVISYFTDTETLAIYTNAAKMLPFDMVAMSFMIVLVPIITRFVRYGKLTHAQQALKEYLRISYLTTWIFVVGAIVCAKEMLLFFYDEKYLPGLSVFIIYLLVDMIRFANVTLVLTAKGKTKVLMYWSLVVLGVNFILNIGAFWLFGVPGPALATLAVTVGLMGLFLVISAREIQTTFSRLFDRREVVMELLQLFVVGTVAFCIKQGVSVWLNSYMAVLFITYGFFVSVMLWLNRHKLIDCMKAVNRLK